MLSRLVCSQSVIIMEKFNVLSYILIYISNPDTLPLHCCLRRASGYLLSETPAFHHLDQLFV